MPPVVIAVTLTATQTKTTLIHATATTTSITEIIQETKTVTAPAITVSSTHLETVPPKVTIEPSEPIVELSSSVYRSHGDTWYCIGELQYTGTKKARWMDITVYIYSPQGDLLYLQSDTVFDLEPGQKAPFKVMFHSCPEITQHCTYKIIPTIKY